jgi:hypothetical protein
MPDQHEFSASGWNTFDVRSLAAVVHFPTGLEVKVGLMSGDGETRHREFRWPELARLGPHMPDCSYAAVTLQTPECRLLVEFASEDGALAVRAAPMGDAAALRPFADVFLYRGFDGQVLPGERIANVTTPHGAFTVSCPGGGTDDQVPLPGTVTFAAAPGRDLIILVSPNGARPGPDAAAAFIDRKKAEAEAWERRFERPDLQPAFEGLWRSVIWNTIYAPSIARPVTVVSRDWCVDGNYGDFVLFEWDTFFAAFSSSLASRELAYANVRAVLSGITERGFVPSIFCELGKSRDRSMLPVGSYIVLKLYERFGDKDFLEEVFPALLGWHEWWMGARDGNADGLLEWGSDDYPSPHPQWQSHTLQAARYESGLDNSPMYDDAEFDADANTMRLADVGLNSAYAMDAWALARIADELGEREQADRLTHEHEKMKRRINEALWSEEHGIYLNRLWDGSFSGRLAPTLFYPLIGRAAEPDRARRVVREHLLSREEFWGEHVIPSISRSDPAFPDQDYWRGRIWGPMNWLVYEGLKAYGFNDAARQMGEKCLRTFLAEWLEESHVHENYNAVTGEGDDARYSEPVYFWGGLLALIGLLETEKRLTH